MSVHSRHLIGVQHMKGERKGLTTEEGANESDLVHTQAEFVEGVLVWFERVKELAGVVDHRVQRAAQHSQSTLHGTGQTSHRAQSI